MSEHEQTGTKHDLMVSITINGRALHFPWYWTRLAILHHLPEWLRNSSAEPPDAPPGEKNMIPKGAVLALRSTIKAAMRPFLPAALRALYGKSAPELKVRQDTLPIIATMLIDFLLRQLYLNPMEVDYDEASGVVTGVRPRQRLVETDDTKQPDGGLDTERDGSQN